MKDGLLLIGRKRMPRSASFIVLDTKGATRPPYLSPLVKGG
jgi:hypothetical protein